MPRRTLDQGAQPFEFRPGTGGFPTLGGMFRAGDPAMIPPHKHHLVVNCRITPDGFRERPGLATVLDTGRSECIDGITEQPDSAGQMGLLWPGFITQPAGGTQDLNAATFRAIFPNESLTYSEYLFVLEASAAKTERTLSPVMGIKDALDPTVVCSPFFFRGTIHVLRLGEAGRLALYEVPLAARSKVPAADCSRSDYAPGGLLESPPISCPVGTGPTGSELWPYEHPVSTVVKKWELDPAFGAWTFASIDPWSEPGRGLIVVAERMDNPLDGTPGVAEILYWLMNDGVHDQVLRWDGAELSVVHEVTFTGGTIGAGPYGPWVVSADPIASSGTMDYLGADGAWHSCAPFTGTLSAASHWSPKVWKGFGDGRVLMHYGTPPPVNWNGHISVLDFDYPTETFNESELLYDAEGPPDVYWMDGVEHQLGAKALANLNGPGFMLAYGGVTDLWPLSVGPVWIQLVGGQVLVGGLFTDANDPVTRAGTTGGDRHAVFDVTDLGAVRLSYQVYDTEQPEDSGAHQPSGRYSLGCMTGVPGGADTGEGFGGDFGGLG